MNERRDFLKVASFLPLSMLGGTETLAANSPGVVDHPVLSPAAEPVPLAPTPPNEPITEQHFGDYQLLGRPDPNANLFGGVRPPNWRVVKSELQSALHNAAHPNDPIHKWLTIFETSFDVRAVDIIIRASREIYQPGHPSVLRYEPQLYDGLLRAATVLLDRCLRYRVEMGQYEISGISAAISYLTFTKLKPLQRNFLIQSNSAEISRIEKITSKQASPFFKRLALSRSPA